MNKQMVEQALATFSSRLVENPRWIILQKRNGQLLGRIGDFDNLIDFTSPCLDEEIATTHTHAHGSNEIEMLNALKHGNFQYSVSIGSAGTYFIFHLNDTYFLGISYQGVGVESIDKVLESVLANFYELLAALSQPT
jgi:hypothetical protein